MATEMQIVSSPKMTRERLVLGQDAWASLAVIDQYMKAATLEHETYSIQALQSAEGFRSELGLLLKDQALDVGAEVYKYAVDIKSHDHRGNAHMMLDPQFTTDLLDKAEEVIVALKPFVQDELARQVRDRIKSFLGKGRQTVF